MAHDEQDGPTAESEELLSGQLKHVPISSRECATFKQLLMHPADCVSLIAWRRSPYVKNTFKFFFLAITCPGIIARESQLNIDVSGRQLLG